MQFQEIKEPVEAVLRVGSGKLVPERVMWRQTEYHVAVVNHVWQQKLGQHSRIHIACVTKKGATFELAIDPLDLSCRLARLSVG